MKLVASQKTCRAEDTKWCSSVMLCDTIHFGANKWVARWSSSVMLYETNHGATEHRLASMLSAGAQILTNLRRALHTLAGCEDREILYTVCIAVRAGICVNSTDWCCAFHQSSHTRETALGCGLEQHIFWNTSPAFAANTVCAPMRAR